MEIAQNRRAAMTVQGEAKKAVEDGCSRCPCTARGTGGGSRGTRNNVPKRRNLAVVM